MKHLLLTISLLFSIVSFAQSEEDSLRIEDMIELGLTEEEIVDGEPTCILYMEKSPEFPGGYDSLKAYFRKNLKKSTECAHAEGRIFVQFIVKESGKVSKVELVKGLHEKCDKEALRVVRTLPNFQPGELDGEKVKMKMIIPVSFKM